MTKKQMDRYKSTTEYRMQGHAGEYWISGNYRDEMGRTVCEIVYSPNDRRLLDLSICRVYSGRTDAEIIAQALRGVSKRGLLERCKRCDCTLTKRGYCMDVTCPYSDHKQDETFTEG